MAEKTAMELEVEIKNLNFQIVALNRQYDEARTAYNRLSMLHSEAMMDNNNLRDQLKLAWSNSNPWAWAIRKIKGWFENE